MSFLALFIWKLQVVLYSVFIVSVVILVIYVEVILPIGHYQQLLWVDICWRREFGNTQADQQTQVWKCLLLTHRPKSVGIEFHTMLPTFIHATITAINIHFPRSHQVISNPVPISVLLFQECYVSGISLFHSGSCWNCFVHQYFIPFYYSK